MRCNSGRQHRSWRNPIVMAVIAMPAPPATFPPRTRAHPEAVERLRLEDYLSS